MATGGGGARPVWDLQDRLAKALKHGHVSKTTMADYLQVHDNTALNYLTGKTKIPYSALVLWAQRTGVDPEWLAGDDYPTRRIRVRRTASDPSSAEPPCASEPK